MWVALIPHNSHCILWVMNLSLNTIQYATSKFQHISLRRSQSSSFMFEVSLNFFCNLFKSNSVASWFNSGKSHFSVIFFLSLYNCWKIYLELSHNLKRHKKLKTLILNLLVLATTHNINEKTWEDKSWYFLNNQIVIFSYWCINICYCTSKIKRKEMEKYGEIGWS